MTTQSLKSLIICMHGNLKGISKSFFWHADGILLQLNAYLSYVLRIPKLEVAQKCINLLLPSYFQEIPNIGTINVRYPIPKHGYKYESEGKWLMIKICDSDFHFSISHLCFLIWHCWMSKAVTEVFIYLEDWLHSDMKISICEHIFFF